MGTFAESHRRLAALAEIAAGDRVTQRSLAERLEISLGLANALLRELEEDGLVRTNAAGAQASRYAMTRAGRAAMARLSRAFAAEAAALLRKSLGGRAGVAKLPAMGRRPEAKRGR